MNDGGGPGNPEESLAREKEAHYEASVPEQQRSVFAELGVAQHAKELSWVSKNPQKTEDGELTPASKQTIIENLGSITQRIVESEMEESKQQETAQSLDAFVDSLTVGDKPMRAVLGEIAEERERDRREGLREGMKQTIKDRLGDEESEKYLEGMDKLTRYSEEKIDKNEPITPEKLDEIAESFIAKGAKSEELEKLIDESSLNDEEKAQLKERVKARSGEKQESGDALLSEEEKQKVEELHQQTEEQMKSVKEQIEEAEQAAAKEQDPVKKSKLKEAIARARKKYSGLDDFFTEATAKDWRNRAGKVALISLILAAAFVVWEMQLIGRMSKK